MSQRVAYLEAVVGADITQFRKGMRDVRNETGILSEAMDGLSAVGRGMTLAITAPLLALGSYTVQAASAFDGSMRNVNSILQLSEDQFGSLEQQVVDFGTTIRSGPMGAAQALYIAVSAGITNTATAMDFMSVAAKTAQAGLVDVDVATNALVASFLSYGGDKLPLAEQLGFLTHQSDVLSEMVMVGVGNMSAFATAQANAIPVASALGASYDDLGGILAFLTQRGLSASTAGVSLTAAMTSLMKPSEGLAANFTALGVSSGEGLIKKFGGLDEAMVALINRAKEVAAADGMDLSSVIAGWFPNVRAQRAVLSMANNLESLGTVMDDFHKNVEGATGRAEQEQLKSFAAHWDLMTSAISGAAITIGQTMLPVISPLLDKVADIATNLASTNPQVVAFGVAIAGVVAATGPVLWLLGSLLNPVALVIAAVGGLAAAFTLDFGNIRETINTAITGIFGNISGVNSAVQLLLQMLFPPDTSTTFTEGVLLAIPKVTIDPTQVLTFTVAKSGGLWDTYFQNPQLAGAFKDPNAFIRAARAAGIKQTELKPGDVLTISKTFDQETTAMATTLVQGVVNGVYGVLNGLHPVKTTIKIDPKLSVGENLANAKQLFDLEIAPMLKGLLAEVQAKVDELGGKGIDLLASLFSGAGSKGGNTPLYNAVSKLFDLDIGGAINAILPGLGTNIQTTLEGWGISITNAFPKIQTAIGSLLTKAANWLLTEGIPTMERASGSLAGHLVSALYDAIGAAFNFLSGASGARDAMGDYVTGTIIPEWEAGFNDAIKGSKLQIEGLPAISAALKSFTDGISAAATALNIDTLWQGGVDFINGIITAAQDLAAADWSGIGKLVTDAANLAGAIVSITAAATGAVLTAVGNALPLLATGVHDLVNAVALLVTAGDPSAILHGLAKGVAEIGGAIATIGASAIESMAGFLSKIFNFDFNSQDLPGKVKAWTDAVVKGIDDDFKNISLGAVVIDPSGTVTVKGSNIAVQAADADSLGDQLNPKFQAVLEDYWALNPPNAQIDHLTLSMAENGSVLLTESYDPHFNLPDTRFSATLDPANGTWGWADAPVTATAPVDVSVPVGAFTLDWNHVNAGMPTGSNPILDAIKPTDDEITSTGTEVVNKFGAAVSPALINIFAAGGVTDPAIVENNFLIPLQNLFGLYLGPESATVKTVTDFAATAGTKFTDIATSSLVVVPAVALAVGGMVASLAFGKPIITNLLGGIKTAVNNVTDAFNKMAAAAAAAMTTASGVPGAPSFGGARAGGGDVQGGSTYLVGEHGPELFTASRSGSIISTEALVGTSRRQSTQNSNTTQTVNIYEANNLDAILSEAKRRGIKLT